MTSFCYNESKNDFRQEYQVLFKLFEEKQLCIYFKLILKKSYTFRIFPIQYIMIIYSKSSKQRSDSAFFILKSPVCRRRLPARKQRYKRNDKHTFVNFL